MSPEESTPSRRSVLARAVFTAISLPVLQTMLESPASAATTTAPGWTPTVKPGDLQDGTFNTDAGPFALARDGANVYALSTKCTHKGGKVKPDPVHPSILLCPKHGARFDISGAVVKKPAQVSLARYPIRLSSAGIIEVDTSRTLTSDDKDSTLVLAK